MVTKPINSIIIVGGGTAGWLAAAYLSQELGTFRPDGVSITLIESSDIPTIGVGEGTFPSLRRTLDVIGIDEQEFISKSEATFKQAIQFTNWMKPTGDAQHTYFHLFDPPKPINNTVDIIPYWLLENPADRLEFAKSVSVQQDICEKYLAPKNATDPNFFGKLNYAYHLDAGKFATLLKERALFARVKHVVGTIKDVNLTENGNIDNVELNNGDSFKADFFIDCTGFAGLLIGKALGSPVKSVQKTLFADTALAVQTPYEDANTPIPSATISTAHEHGWTWDIGLHTRRGIGYVYSSQHTDEDFAYKTLSKYVGRDLDRLTVRQLKMRTGYRENAWVKNCAAIGLSGGFLEPLEATGISLTEAAIKLLADYFPRSGNMEPAQKKFNRVMTRYFEHAVSFIKMHYFLTDRDDTDFWKDNVDPKTAPDELLSLLEFWKHNYPRDTDFEEWQKTFGPESYVYVLLGMNRLPDLKLNESSYLFDTQARQHMDQIRQVAHAASSALPTHRDVISAINKKFPT